MTEDEKRNGELGRKHEGRGSHLFSVHYLHPDPLSDAGSTISHSLPLSLTLSQFTRCLESDFISAAIFLFCSAGVERASGLSFFAADSGFDGREGSGVPEGDFG